jgi:hypothetical protein
MKASLETGLVGSNIFGTSTLDLRFAQQKSLGPRVTFTRASSSGTFVGSDKVLRSAVTNLLVQSQNFSTSWTNINLTSTSGAIAPDGTATAFTVNEATAVAASHSTHAVPALTASNIMTLSVHAKNVNARYVGLSISTTSANNYGTVEFDLDGTGAVNRTAASGTGFSIISSSISAIGSGWFRCVAVIGLGSASVSDGRSTIYVSDGAGSFDTRGRTLYTGTSRTLEIWGAQLEQSSTVGEYIPTTSTINSAPRFDHNPTTGESLGLLVEEPRTNLVRNNTMVGAVAGSPGTPPTNGWVIVNNATYTSSILGTGVENGINYIDIQYVVAAAASAATLFYADTPAGSASTAYTGSYYFKLVSGTSPQVRFVWQDGISTYSRTLFDLTSTLTRYTDTLTTAVGATLARLAVGIAASPSGTTFVIRVGLPQTEQGAFATSPILTSTGTATRAADVASITGAAFSSFYNQAEGTVFSDCVGTFSSTQVLVNIAATAANTATSAISLASNLTSSQKRVRVRDAASADQASLALGGSSSGSRTRIAAAIKANDFAASLDSGAAVTDTTGTVPTVALMEIGSSPSGVTLGTQLHRRLTYWPTRLANTTLQAISQP